MTATKTKQLLSQATAAGKPLRRSAQDSQKSKLYHAEQVLRTDDRYLTERQIVSLIARIRSSVYMQRNYGDPGDIRVVITARRKTTSAADIWGRTMLLAKGWGTQRNVVIHELAHFYASPMGDPGHDWLFCHIYLDMVRKFMGKAQHDALKASFKRNKIRFSPPRKRREMTPAQKAAASERMAKARAARQSSSIEPHVFAWLDTRFGGHERWVLVSACTDRKLNITRQFLRQNGEMSDRVLVRKTDKGVADQMKRLHLWKGSRMAHEVLAVPVSQVQVDANGFVLQDWTPTGVK